mmetsp:Transcript_32109/g.84782  ORF Transcript_32109/g.84782 Transcript_32109/m.84782 type:complete len:328 (-) Transcript_32109:179-1162(-)
MDAKTPARQLVYGGMASCVAEAITIPFDVLKVRLQLQGQGGEARQYRNTLDAIGKITRQEGLMAFTKGLKPAVLRQLTYGSLRFGLYAQWKQVLGATAAKDSRDLLRKVSAGVLSGGSAALVCTPIDVMKIRMQAEGMRPNSGVPAYNGITDAAVKIVQQEGFRGLYKGALPSTMRASVVFVSEVVSYDEMKSAALRSGLLRDGTTLHLATATTSGFLSSVMSSPFDVVKARLMTQPFDERGVGLRYAGMADCFVKSLKAEGPRFAFKGFWPMYMSKGPTVVVMFLLYEQIRMRGDPFLDRWESRPPAMLGRKSSGFSQPQMAQLNV